MLITIADDVFFLFSLIVGWWYYYYRCSLVVVFWDKFSVVFVRFWHCVFSPFGFAVLTPVSAGSVWDFE